VWEGADAMPGKKSKGGKGSKPSSGDLPTEEEVGARISLLKNLGLKEPALIRKMKELKGAVKKGEGVRENLLEEVSSGYERALEGWDVKRAEYLRNLFSKGVKEAIKRGLDEKEFEGIQKEIDSLITKGNGKEALERSRELLGRLDEVFEGDAEVLIPQAWIALDKSLEAYLDVSTTQEATKDTVKYLKKTMKFAEKGDVDNLIVYSNLLYTTVTSELSDEAVKDRFKAVKEEMKELLERIEEYKSYGVEAGEIERELKRIDISMDPKKYKEIRSTVSRIDKSVSRIESEYLRKRGSVDLAESRQISDRYGSLIDMSDLNRRIEKLVKEEGNLSPRKFHDEAQKCLEMGKSSLFNNFRDQVSERIVNLREAYKGETLVSEGEIEEIESLLEMSESSLGSKNITEAMECLSIAEQMFDQGRNEGKMVKVGENYSSLLEQYESLLNEDIEVLELKEQISEIEKMFLSEEVKHEEIQDRIASSKDLIRDRIGEVRKKSINREKEEILSTFEIIDLSYDKREEILSRLEEVENEIGSVDDDTFTSDLGKVKADLEGEISVYFKDHFDDWVGSIRTDMDSLRSKGVDVTTMAEMLETAGERYRDKDYVRSGEVLRNLRNNIKGIDDQIEVGRVEGIINSAEFMFDEAKRAGVDVDREKEVLDKAKVRLSGGELAEAARIAGGVESRVKGMWMEKRKDRIDGDLKDLRDFLEESVEIGLDINEASSLVEEAESLFEEEKFDEADKLVMKVKDSLEDNRRRFFSESSMSSISDIKEDIKGMGEMGVDTLELETMLIEAEKAFMGEDYESSFALTVELREKLKDTREEHLKVKVPVELDSMMKDISRMEVMGIDTEPIRSYMDRAREYEGSGKLMEAHRVIGKAHDIADEVYKGHVSLTLPETIIDVRKEIDNAMEEGIDLTEVKDLLTEAEDFFSKEDYDGALDMVNKVQNEVKERKDDHFRSMYEGRMDEVERLMRESTELDVELDLTQDNLNMARDAYERGDFRDSNTLLERVLSFLEKTKSEKERSRRKEIVQSYFDEVNTLMGIARSERVELDTEDNLLLVAKELMEEGEWDQAEHILEGIKKDVNEKRLNMRKGLMESSIQTTEILLKNMRETGMDTRKEEAMIRELKEALEEGDLEKCDRINRELEESLQKNKTPYMINKVEKEISRLKVRAMEAYRQGIDTSGIMDTLNNAQDRFDRGDLEGAKEGAQKAEGMLDNALDEQGRTEYDSLDLKLAELMAKMEERGIPSEDEEGLRLQSQQLMEEGKLDEAISLLEIAITGAEAKISSFSRMTAEGYIPRIKEYLEGFIERDVDISNLARLYEEGLEAYESGDNEKAITVFSSILDLGEEKRGNIEVERVKSRFKDIRSRLKELKEMGFKASKEIRKGVKEIRLELKGGRADPAQLDVQVDKLSALVTREAGDLFGKVVKKHMGEVTGKYKELKGRGKEDEEIPLLIKEAGEMFRAGDFESAEDAIQSAGTILDDLLSVEEKEAVMEEMRSVRHMLDRLKSMGSDITHAEQLFSKVEVALETDRLENAKKLIHSIRESIKEIVRRNMRESSIEVIQFTEAMINYLKENFTGITQKLTPSEAKLEEARERFREKRYKAAQSLAEAARKEVEEVDLENIKQFLYVFRSMQAEEAVRDVSLRLDELKSKGIDVEKAEAPFTAAKEYFENDSFDEGREMITQARIIISDLDQQSLHDKAFDELNEAHVALITKKKTGADISVANEYYLRAKDAFSLREYKKCILFSQKASHQAKRGR